MAHSFVPPREKAIRILTAVLSDQRPLDDALEEMASSEPADSRAWLLDVCASCLRWKGRLDLVIDSLALKKKPTGWLRKALLVAATQVLTQDRVAPGAVVSETVDLIKKMEGEFPAKFANALLRKVADGREQWVKLPFPKSENAAKKAAWASLPAWFWKRIAHDRGEDWAAAFAQASLERPVTWARAKNDSWKPEGGEPGPVSLSWRLTDGGLVSSRAGFASGDFIVQDISNQILLSKISEAVGSTQGKRALDFCAAPGGKAIALLWNGFTVLASDRPGPRLSLLQQTANRAGGDQLEIVSSEELDPAKHGKFDLVWVDAPCTGSGIVRRHPDSRWLKDEKDFEALAKIQTELIEKAAAFLKPGGFLAYSVCSVFKAEGEGHLPQLTQCGEVVGVWDLGPQDGGGDGFWGCLVRKV